MAQIGSGSITPIGGGVGVGAVDDGTNIIISYLGTKLLAMRKSDSQILIQAGLDGDQTI